MDLSATDYERALLGLAISFPAQLLPALADRLRPRHFEHNLHRRLWQAILGLYERQAAIEAMTVATCLSGADLAAIGGVAGLCALYDGASPDAAGEICRVLDDRAARRALYRLGGQMQSASLDPEADSQTFGPRVLQAVQRLELSVPRRGEATIAWEDAGAQEVPWISYPMIPDRAVTMFAGKEGSGKSLMSIKMASAFSQGFDLLGRRLPAGAIRSLIVNAEDSPAVTGQRLFENGAVRGMVHIFDTSEGGFEISQEWLGRLAATIRERESRLVFIDPIVRMGEAIDFNSQTAVQKLLTPFSRLGPELNCSFIVVAHHNKSKDILGSVAFRTAVRSVLQVYPDPVDDTCAYLVHSKSNYSKHAASVHFRIAGFEGCQPKVEVLGESKRWTYRALKECDLDDRDVFPVKAAEEFLRRSIPKYARITLRDLQARQKDESVMFNVDHLRKAIYRLGMDLTQEPNEADGGKISTFLRWADD